MGQMKIQIKEEICSRKKVWSQINTIQLRQPYPYSSRVFKYCSKETHEWNGKKTPNLKDSVTLCHEIHVQLFHNLSEELIQVLEGCYNIFSHILSLQPPSVNNELRNPHVMWYSHQKVMYLHITHTKQYEKILLKWRENLKH